jgi:hypothetical protein
MTVKEKWSSSSAAGLGAVKLAMAESAPVKITGVPPSWRHTTLTICPSLSCEPLPSSLTREPPRTVWSLPAAAVGAVFGSRVTGTLSAALAPPSSITVRVNVSASSVFTGGLEKLAVARSAPARVTSTG